MSERDKGSFQANIPQEAFAEALRSVERREEGQQGAEVPVETEAAPGEVERLRALLDESAARARETQERLKDTHERLLRSAADFDNYRKRAARDKEETVRFANERLLKDLLPVLDNLERALASAQAAATDPAALLQGVQLVARQWVDVLGRHGVKPFESAGQPFDPTRHEALMEQESAAVPPHHVAAEMVKGYMLNDRLLRPAAVIVARAPAAPPPGQATEQPSAPPAGGGTDGSGRPGGEGDGSGGAA